MIKKDAALLFDDISQRYDLSNTIISLGLEKIWRRHFLKRINAGGNAILDACCGSGTGCQPMTPSSSPPPCIYSQVIAATGAHTYKVRVWDGSLNQYVSPQKTFTVAPDMQLPTITKSAISFPTGAAATGSRPRPAPSGSPCPAGPG